MRRILFWAACIYAILCCGGCDDISPSCELNVIQSGPNYVGTVACGGDRWLLLLQHE